MMGMKWIGMGARPGVIRNPGRFAQIKASRVKNVSEMKGPIGGDETVCKFCSDNARVDVVSPCFASECQETEDYEGAKACDDHVAGQILCRNKVSWPS